MGDGSKTLHFNHNFVHLVNQQRYMSFFYKKLYFFKEYLLLFTNIVT